jgi:hypothetical protein
VAIEELVRRRQAFAERLAVADAGDDVDESAAIADTAALIPECAALNLRFALEPEGRDTIETLEKLLGHLDNYRALREGVCAAYADERVTSAPLQDWLSE